MNANAALTWTSAIGTAAIATSARRRGRGPGNARSRFSAARRVRGPHRVDAFPACLQRASWEWREARDVRDRLTVVMGAQDGALLRRGRVAHERFEDESVQLRLRQRIGPFVLDRVLGREHQERVGKWQRLDLEGHMALFNRLAVGA